MNKTEKMIGLLARIVLNDGDKDTAAEELKTILNEQNPEQKRDGTEYECEIEKILFEIGVPCHIVGHEGLKKAIALVVDDPQLRYSTIKIYEKVAVEMGGESTPSKVERGIRHAISSAWNRGDVDVLYKYFGNTVDPNKGKPTNAEFICAAAQEIRRRFR